MIKYNKNKPLIFIHIPKCAGTSVDSVLKKWFRKNFLRHGFIKQNKWYRSTPYDLRPGICISGHFSRRRNGGVQFLYPEVDQFITFLREPFEAQLSQYFFWKKKRRKTLIDQGILKEGSEEDFKNVNDFMDKRNKSFLLNFTPCEVTIDNFKEVFNKYYVYIGVVEDIQTSMDVLANKLHFPPQKIGRFNPSERNEKVPDELKEEFIKNNQLEYHIYNYILRRYKQ